MDKAGDSIRLRGRPLDRPPRKLFQLTRDLLPPVERMGHGPRREPGTNPNYGVTVNSIVSLYVPAVAVV